MSQLCRHVKEPSTSVNYECASKIRCIVPSFANRGLSCLCGAWRLWRWMRELIGGKGTIGLQGCSAEKAPHATCNLNTYCVDIIKQQATSTAELWDAVFVLPCFSYIWLRTGRSGDRIPVGARLSAPVQSCPGAHPLSRTRSVIPQLPLWASMALRWDLPLPLPFTFLDSSLLGCYAVLCGSFRRFEVWQCTFHCLTLRHMKPTWPFKMAGTT